MYENFMVCNYGVGVSSKTTCDDLTNKKAVISSKNETETTVIKYYTVTSEVIKDVKGQLISELLFGVFNFPKNQRKNLMNFCPRI